MTFSIVGYDPTTEELGVAVASKFLACGALVPFAKAGVGAIATQSWVNLDYATKGIELLEQNLSPEEVLQELIKQDEGHAVRQVGIVDFKGNSVTYTGQECHAWAGGINGLNFACQGNILIDEKTVQEMAQSFLNSEGTGTLGDRLLKALIAGEKAGGDSRGKQAAGLLVVKENGGYGGYNDRAVDLRVDDHPEPVLELIRIHELHKLYFMKSKPEDILVIKGELRRQLATMLTALGYLKSADQTDEELFEALKTLQLIENFDERIQEKGLIDRKVVEFMAQMTDKLG